MNIKVSKITNKELLKLSCETTIDRLCNPSLKRMYASEHSPVRTQMFYIECKNIPLFVSTHLLRHHVGSQPFALTHRVDRDGAKDNLNHYLDKLYELKDLFFNKQIKEENFRENFNKYLILISDTCGRNEPTDLSLFVNAQGLINMAQLRLCKKASLETQNVFKEIASRLKIVDPHLFNFLVPKCVYRNGICGEISPCGYMMSSDFSKRLLEYRKLFKQVAIIPNKIKL